MVETAHGAVRGRRTGKVTVFHGIPYAAAPVGKLRFAPPAAPRSWTGTRDCRQPGPGAPQTTSRLANTVGPMRFPQSEDCLTLNVWTPGTRGSRPVLVWLHGGGFTSGSASQEWYDGTQLASRGDIVVVTVNYRLGALGYLYLAELAEDLGAGNFGLLDQLAALRWVRDHIATFGGDPHQVTLAGQSAGALSTMALMSTSDNRDLFQRAILQSTPAGVPPATPTAATEVAEKFLRALETPAHGLRTLPVARLLTAQDEVARAHARPLRVDPPCQLVATPDLVPADLLATSGAVPSLISVTRDEASAFASHEDARLMTDKIFHRDLPTLARNAYVCQLDWHPEGSPLGACHCMELPFMFDTLPAWQAAPMLTGGDPGQESALVEAIQPAWIAFIRTGNPNHPGIPHWSNYSTQEQILHLGRLT